MDGFWICSDCGSANEYPNIIECEVCGKQIDDSEIKKADKHIREALKMQDQIRRNEEREEKARKKQELEKKRKAEYEKKQREIQKRLQSKQQKKEENVKKYIDFERNFYNGFYKFTKLIKNCFVVFFVVCFLIVSISIVRQNNLKVVLSEIESITETVVQDCQESHYYIKKNGEKVFKPFINIEKQYKHLEKQANQSENIKKIIEVLGW